MTRYDPTDSTAVVLCLVRLLLAIDNDRKYEQPHEEDEPDDPKREHGNPRLADATLLEPRQSLDIGAKRRVVVDRAIAGAIDISL